MTASHYIMSARGEAADAPLAKLAQILSGEGKVIKHECLGGRTTIIISMSSGETVEIVIHSDEAKGEDEAAAGAVNATAGGSGNNPTGQGTWGHTQVFDPYRSRSSNEYDAQGNEGNASPEAGSSGPSRNHGTTGNDQQTFADFLTVMSEEEGELMRAQGHAAVYNRPRILQRPSWETTEEDMVGVNPRLDEDDHFWNGDINYDVNEDM